MKKIGMFFITVIVVLVTGCYEDKGNYDYKEMPKVSVDGLESSYNVYVGDLFVVKPEVAWENGEPENLSYVWRVNNVVISEKKDLDFTVGGIPVKAGLYAEYTIKDEDTGVEHIFPFRVSVFSTFYSGWMLLADKGSTSELSYVRDDGELFPDVYNLINGNDLSGGAYALMEHWLPWSSESGQVFVACQGGADYSVEIDGNSFEKIVATKDEFVGEFPVNFKPMSMKCVANYDYLVSNGKLYVRYIEATTSALYQDGLFPNFPYPGDYELTGWGMRGNLVFSNDIIYFDKKSSSYLLARNGELSRFDYTNDSEKAFKPSDMGKTVLDGGAISTATPTDEFLTILKDNNENRAYVQKFKFSGWGAKKYTSQSEVEFPDPSIIGEETKFAVCQNRPYVYIASGNVLYVYNHKDNSLKPLRSDFGRKILDIACCPTNFERLGVVLVNAGDASKSDFMELDVSVVGGGKTVEGMEHLGKFGPVVDIVYKVGNQWDVPY